MKYQHFLLAVLISALTVTGCKKEKESPQKGSVNVINAAINLPSVKVNYFGTPITWSAYAGTTAAPAPVLYSSNKIYGVFAGNPLLTIVSTADTLHPVFNGSIPLTAGEIYSLYLAGQAPAFESLVIKDNIPAFYLDSVVGIRIINLSPNSTPLNITLASATTTNVFMNVGYKQLTDFVKFPVPTVTPANNVTFQVRDAAGVLLTSYVIPTSAATAYPGITVALSRFRNLTLVIKGLQGITTGTQAIGLFPVANY